MTFDEDLALFRSTYPADFVQRHPDWGNLIWALERTVESNPEKWGWIGKLCSCGEPAELWSAGTGYLCKFHVARAAAKT